MGFFDFFKKKPDTEKSTALPETEKKVIIPQLDEKTAENIIQIAKIISNNDLDVVRDFTELVTDYTAFYQKHEEWCDDMVAGVQNHMDIILLILAYWLAGYDTDYKYGGYIDWKEETSEIVWHLDDALKNLKYPLDINAVKFTGEEFTDAALAKIDEHFMKSGYNLFTLDTGGDCYHLFIAAVGDYEKLVKLGDEVGFTFTNEYV